MNVDLLVNTGPATLTKQWEVNGTISDVGVVTFTVTNAAGTVIQSGTATKTGSGVTTVYTFPLTLPTAVNVYRVRWIRSDTTAFLEDRIEIVGSYLFTEAQARAKQTTGQAAPLSSETAYPDYAIHEWRVRIQEAFEQRTGRSWVRRYCRLEIPGYYGYQLNLSDGYPRTAAGDEVAGPGRIRDIRRILAATVDGSAVTASNIKAIGSTLHRTDGIWGVATPSNPLNVVIEYEYGIDPTMEAQENGLRAIVALAPPQSRSDWATSVTDESGTRSFELAWPPKVWDWLKTADKRVAIA